MDKGSAAYFWIIFACLTCFNLPFIIVDLVFATRNPECTSAQVQGFTFTLSTWLQVDGYMRISILALFFLVAVISCCNIQCAVKMFICTLIVIVLYSLFNLGWLIAGAVMFWGNLNDTGLCDSELTGYMFAVLILGFLGVCGNCFTSYSQRQN